MSSAGMVILLILVFLVVLVALTIAALALMGLPPGPRNLRGGRVDAKMAPPVRPEPGPPVRPQTGGQIRPNKSVPPRTEPPRLPSKPVSYVYQPRPGSEPKTCTVPGCGHTLEPGEEVVIVPRSDRASFDVVCGPCIRKGLADA